MDLKLKGKKVLVTGSTAGIGFAIAQGLAQEGASVVINGRTDSRVQAALQQQGYYRGGVDGLIGPLTRGAIADYQRDHGLYMTSTIDQPTLQSLGMA